MIPRSSDGGDMSLWHKGRLVCEILSQYAPLRRSLRRDEFPTVLAAARATRCAATARSADDEHATAVRLGSIVGQVLDRLPTDSRCLIQSLVLLRVLARRGIGAELIIGVHEAHPFAAHAWVEHDGRPLLPAGDFEQLTRL